MSGQGAERREAGPSSVGESSERPSSDVPEQKGACPLFPEEQTPSGTVRKTGDFPYSVVEAVRAAGLDTVEGAFVYRGGQDLDKPNLGSRKRTRVTLTDAAGRTHELYLKRYGPQRLTHALRRRWMCGSAKSPAEVEFDNIRAAREAGIATMQAVLAGGESGKWARGRSFVIVMAPSSSSRRIWRGWSVRCIAPDGCIATCTPLTCSWTNHRGGRICT